MSIKKVTLASLILLSLTACSSGSSSNDNAAKQVTQVQKAITQGKSSLIAGFMPIPIGTMMPLI